MKPIVIVATAGAERRFIDAAARALEREFETSCLEERQPLDISFAFHPERNQYHSSAILQKLPDRGVVTVVITNVDLFIPILTFVFGEAQVGGYAAVVSYHRLRQEFYGLDADDRVVADRLAKEAVHEAGHVFGLTHCDDYECVMAASHAVEWLDLKTSSLCVECGQAALTR
jgi:archaemetzincin